MSIIKSRIHDCYDHYELKKKGKPFKCHGCKMTGVGQRYACCACVHKLHRECRYPKSLVNHENFGCSTFKFLETPFTKFNKSSRRREYSKRCDACGKDICGFSYHCEEDNLDLHPCCRNLKKKLLINDTVFNLGSKVSSKCMLCKKRKISDGGRDVPGWSYVSTCRKYHIHVYCMTKMVHEAMKHGNLAMEKVESRNLAWPKRNGGSGRTTFETIKSFLKIILSVLLGDPTLLITNVVMELVTGGLR